MICVLETNKTIDLQVRTVGKSRGTDTFMYNGRHVTKFFKRALPIRVYPTQYEVISVLESYYLTNLAPFEIMSIYDFHVVFWEYVLDSCKSHEVDSIVVYMARYTDEQNRLKAEALARKRQEEISARLEAQRLKKNEV